MNLNKVGIVSLGCPKNLADMEAVLAQLKNIEIVSYQNANIVFLNTCGFLKKSRDEVFEYLKKFSHQKVIVMGCLASWFDKKVTDKYPQIQAVITSANYKKIPEILSQVIRGKKVFAISKEPEKFETFAGKSLLTPRSYAYVKIAEGCDNKCSYCLIPYLKGKYRSRQMSEILEEIKGLVKIGVKEISLVAQDCGYYGMDLRNTNLTILLKNIIKIPGDFRVRLLYIYPERLNDELLNLIASSEKLCKYLDIPLQHGDSEILKKMYRPNNLENIYKKIANIRKIIPNVTLRTSLITGFPGEQEKHFQNLLQFIKKINFDHVGVFEYSREKFTPAYSLPDQQKATTKKQRRNKAMLLQQKISLKNNRAQIGKILKTVIEDFDKKSKKFIGRPDRYAPEIDGLIFIDPDKHLHINQFANIKITDASHYDLYGKRIV